MAYQYGVNAIVIFFQLHYIYCIKTSATYTFKNSYHAELIVKGGINCAFLIPDDYRVLSGAFTGCFIKNQKSVRVGISVLYRAFK